VRGRVSACWPGNKKTSNSGGGGGNEKRNVKGRLQKNFPDKRIKGLGVPEKNSLDIPCESSNSEKKIKIGQHLPAKKSSGILSGGEGD